jgi:hypothetical protein
MEIAHFASHHHGSILRLEMELRYYEGFSLCCADDKHSWNDLAVLAISAISDGLHSSPGAWSTELLFLQALCAAEQ